MTDAGQAEDTRPIHCRPVSFALVFLGGTAGTAVREAISVTWDSDIPYAILSINIAGAFLLGILLDALARRGPDHGRRRALRLLLGTGALGGFTTYSALAAASAVLIDGGRVGAGIAYALATVIFGALATGAGIAVATVLHRPQQGRERP